MHLFVALLKILLISFIEKPLPKNPFKVDKVLARQIFIELNKEALDSKNINFINEFEENNEYAIDSSSV